LVPAFLESKRAGVLAAISALERKDCAPAGNIGHQLKGEGGAYGFDRLTEMGRELEEAAKRDNCASAFESARRLADYLGRIEVAYAPRTDSFI
jgi:HPt (histidine-containing phosphotransfer) domain-containing protein